MDIFGISICQFHNLFFSIRAYWKQFALENTENYDLVSKIVHKYENVHIKKYCRKYGNMCSNS